MFLSEKRISKAKTFHLFIYDSPGSVDLKFMNYPIEGGGQNANNQPTRS